VRDGLAHAHPPTAARARPRGLGGVHEDAGRAEALGRATERATSVEDLRRTEVLRFHPLKGARKGEHAIWLTNRARLIVTFADKAMTVVRIEEVSVDHYGD
jgi:hypothetical protein